MTVRPPTTAWLPFGCGPADAGARMFCLPFAGGGASNFMPWRRLLPAVGVAPVQYPGRETRLDEPPPRQLPELVAQLADAIAPWADRPYLLFGYSMGARLAFALAHEFARRGVAPPQALLVAAHVPPDGHSQAARSLALDDAGFKCAIRAYGGMPEELLEDADFCAMVLPVLRADFALAVQEIPTAPLDCPVVAYAGSADAHAGPAVMQGWQRFTRGRFTLREFAGGHFFFRDAPGFDAALVDDVTALLAAAPQPVSRSEVTA